MKIFDELETDLIDKDEAVQQAEQARASPPFPPLRSRSHFPRLLVLRQEGQEQGARRAARYFMYRKWVFARYGTLGKGNRVRIPPCVVEFIRARYREPGCACLSAGRCTRARRTATPARPSGEEE